MSDENEQVPESPEFAAPISAMPPRIMKQEESQKEVLSSAAFTFLDDLYYADKLSQSKVLMLKTKYTELHDMLRRTRDHETTLQQKVKEFQTDLDCQKAELERGDDFPEATPNDVGKLRIQLLGQNNELTAHTDRQAQLDYKIEMFEEEKRMLDREYARMPKEGEMDRKIDELKAVCNDLKRKIAQRRTEAEALKEEVEKSQYLEKNSKEFEDTKKELQRLRFDFMAANAQPNMIAKSTIHIVKNRLEFEKKGKELNVEINGLMEHSKEILACQNLLDLEKKELEQELAKRVSYSQIQLSAFENLMKDYDYAKIHEIEFLGVRATIDMNLRHLLMDKKSMQESYTRKCWEKEHELRHFKRAERQLQVGNDGLTHIEHIHKKIKLLIDTQPKDDGTLLQRRQELTREVHVGKRHVSSQKAITAADAVKVEQSIAKEEQLLYTQSNLRVEVVELTRLGVIKHSEREHNARDYMRIKLKYNRMQEEVKRTQLGLQEKLKKYEEIKLKVREFSKLYDAIKVDRNRCLNLIQKASQKAEEMLEKKKMLSNEMEILHTTVANRDRQLQKKHFKHANAITFRDSIKNEVVKQNRLDHEMSAKKEEQRMNLNKLNLLINHCEEVMVDQRKRYETAIENRNDRGIQLIERDEEVCVFYEKVNIQEQMIHSGNLSLQGRAEEIRFLKMQLKDEQRVLDHLGKTVPNKTKLEKNLIQVRSELLEVRNRVVELEKQIQNPEKRKLVRYIEGKDPVPAIAELRIEDIELRLAEKEEQLLEKDLILEQDCRLIERVDHKVNSGHDDGLEIAKRMNLQQANIKHVTRKLMSIISELSMVQAQARSLQEELKESRAHMEHVRMRVENGEAPTRQMETECLKQLHNERIREFQREQAALAAEDEDQEPGSVTTTAQPRPNAYIPDDDASMPLPRPYGKNAPFKPTEAGSNMRHIRRPIPKPIQI